MKSLLIQYKMLLIFMVDLATAFLALLLMLGIRYGVSEGSVQFQSHLVPFTIITLLFTLVFYIFNLYSFRFNKNITEFTSSFTKSLIISFILSVLIFYTFGNLFKLTPKTNLVLFTLFFGIIDFYLRIIIKRSFIKNGVTRKVVIISDTENKLVQELEHNQNIGYKIVAKNKNISLEEINSLNPDVIAIDNSKVDLDKIYILIKRGIFVYTINNFYEEVFQKVPTDRIDREEIIAYMGNDRTIFNFTKRFFDIIFSTFLIIATSPILLITFLIIKTTSKGPSLFPHIRVSLNDSEFTIYKFRSMYTDAEKNGAVWTENIDTDPRITPFGKFIRKTHLDELPQLFNILKGDISFVGPRPERPEFVGKLKNDILYYDLRHSVKAGLTGWAQVNYKYGASVEDAKEKLKYDFYYMKNRSIFFDFLIILKTAAEIFKY